MIHHSPGVLAGSRIYFHQPSPLAKECFFYPLCIGHFYCDTSYHIERNSYDSYLLMLIIKGTGTVCSQGHMEKIKSGDVIFLDCYLPHSYTACKDLEFLWIHIDGPMCRSYHHLFSSSRSLLHSFLDKRSYQSFEAPLQYLFHTFSHSIPCSEIWMSKLITDMLSALLQSSTHTTVLPADSSMSHGLFEATGSTVTPFMDQIQLYLREHFQEPLTIEDLSSHVSLSPYHFIRRFKKETSMTPHQYLTLLRINSAKFHLRTSMATIKEISYQCGFINENSFCVAFRRECGMTPTEYRKLDAI